MIVDLPTWPDVEPFEKEFSVRVIPQPVEPPEPEPEPEVFVPPVNIVVEKQEYVVDE